jgi:hypothetical protein
MFGGGAEGGPFAVPKAIQSVEGELKDALLKPDLLGNPEGLKRQEKKTAY